MIVLIILILPVQEHGISYHLFLWSSISVINILQFLQYSSFVSFVGIFFFFFFFFFCGVQLLSTVVLSPALQQSESAVYMHIYHPPDLPSHSPSQHCSRSSQSTELSSLCYTAASHQLSLLHVSEYMSIIASQFFPPTPSPWGHKSSL